MSWPALRGLRRLAPLLLVGLSVLPGCLSTRQLSTSEQDQIAWFIEDLAHGTPRRPAELELVASSPAMKRVQVWARSCSQQIYGQNGTLDANEYVPPTIIVARAERWPALHNLFVLHQAVVLANGMVGVRPGVNDDDTLADLPIIDRENNDRRELDAQIIGLARLDVGERAEYQAAAARARIDCDQRGGAQRWPETAPASP